ncbi:hypothetical protein CSR02_08355 [Acetobacter pomorum]|uniref:Uncharacterized protein n=1 Tax=Acetobacter pomorum TaxID=65959 RepID=A0A2G4RBW0_9PROT|nr:hypothetical protein CSR02_08355 [Acetobacter pomorum]
MFRRLTIFLNYSNYVACALQQTEFGICWQTLHSENCKTDSDNQLAGNTISLLPMLTQMILQPLI